MMLGDRELAVLGAQLILEILADMEERGEPVTVEGLRRHIHASSVVVS